ncbi:MAG: deoxyribodipyrimidine photo-lyase [Prolixibacteraceae bacterium]
MKQPISIVWLRRDLRLADHTALNAALNSGSPVLMLFIFDTNILSELPQDDARVNFIYETLQGLHQQLKYHESALLIEKGEPLNIWRKLLSNYSIAQVYTSKDYEPYAMQRDQEVQQVLQQNNIEFHALKDQVIFEENEVLKNDGTPYTIFTPYKNKWLEKWNSVKSETPPFTAPLNFEKTELKFPSREELNIDISDIKIKPWTLENIGSYTIERNIPSLDSTSYLSPHLRFGTVSIRQIIHQLNADDTTFLSELIWREFFMQILFHFPGVVTQNFKAKYDGIPWRNNEQEFQLWCDGKTGYPMVDAGMRQLNATGYMHNRVRMITAGFLCKHLLIDWRWGEAYFAKKLLDYELSSNNGNWQWAAGTGCDAAPYFRVFNPTEQLKKFDPQFEYIKRWIPEWNSFDYPNPMVDHAFARTRAIETYKKGILR